MAVPTRRKGVMSKRVRRQHLALKATNAVSCPNCGAMIKSHRVCPNCGFYKGKQVLAVKESE